MTIKDNIEAERAAAHSLELNREKARTSAARAEARAAAKETEALRKDLASLRQIDGANVRVTPWSRPRKKIDKRATALLMLSDWHFDEVVAPSQIIGPTGQPLNAYNRRIAEQRLKRTIDGVDVVTTELLRWEYDGLIVLLGGDMLSGDIHEELKRTNEGPTIAGVDHWADPLASALSTLADRFGKIHVPCVVGNHGRNRIKWYAKEAVTDSFDWLLYRIVQRELQGDKRISWYIPESVDAYFQVYDHLHLLTHGNQARGGAGIAGLATPLALFDHKKRKRDATAGAAASHTWIGHFHTYLRNGTLTVNGSGKGTDEYSYGGNFGHERPQQAFAVITPEQGVTAELPIYCDDRKAEGW